MTTNDVDGFVRRSSRVRKPIEHLEPVISCLTSTQSIAASQGKKKPPPPPKTRRGRDKRAVNPKYLVDAQTGQQVWITNVSLQDIQNAKKRQASPWGGQPRLVTVDSVAQRHAVYQRAAQVLADLEERGLPRYGGRPWTCHVTVRAEKGAPYFCFRGAGVLELAAWPSILEKRPRPPKFPHHDARFSDLMIEREASAISRLAASESWRVPIPSFDYRWVSPLKESFHSRAAVWKHAEDLCKKEATIEKILTGLLPSGNMTKLQLCPQKVALSTGKLRFERDGLWIVGQEEFWGRERLSGTAATMIVDHPPASAKRRATGLSCFIESNRKEHKAKRISELKATMSAQSSANPSSSQPAPKVESRVFDVMSYGKTAAKQQGQALSPAVLGNTYVTSATMAAHSSCTPPNKCEPHAASPWTGGYQSNNETSFSGSPTDTSMQTAEPATAESPSSQHSSALLSSTQPNDEQKISHPSTTGTFVTPYKPQAISFTLRDAEIELRSLWKELSKEEQARWNDEAERKNRLAFKEISACVVSDESADEGSKGFSSRSESPQTLALLPSNSSQTGQEAEMLTKKDDAVWRSTKLLEFHRSSKWCLTQEQVQLCYKAGMEHYDQIMHTVKARDLCRELQDGFDLLRERGRGRFDMELPAFEDAAFSFFNTVQKAPWMPIVKTILGKEVVLIHKGIFLSMPGAERQPYHQDGPHLNDQIQKPCHAINVFVPLVDLTLENGPTEFCLGSHILGYEEYKEELCEISTVSAGTPVIFDYRLGHRGLANDSNACRPILYCTYAAAAGGKEFRDSVNFSRKRYHRIGDLIEKGLSRDERARKRVRVKDDSALEQAIAESLAATSSGVAN